MGKVVGRLSEENSVAIFIGLSISAPLRKVVDKAYVFPQANDHPLSHYSRAFLYIGSQSEMRGRAGSHSQS